MARVEAAAHAWTVTAAPMLSGTAVTVIGLMPVGFAASSAGEYAGNIFWIVAFSLLMSWLVAVVFTPYLGVKLLPAVTAVPGGARAIYDTPRYRQLRALVAWCVRRKGTVALVVLLMFGASVAAMVVVKKQFFPVSERPELIVEVTLPSGTDIGPRSARPRRSKPGCGSSRSRASSPPTSGRARRASSFRCRRNCPTLRSPRSSC
jgi:multidrug efflux pump subunit AcrB